MPKTHAAAPNIRIAVNTTPTAPIPGEVPRNPPCSFLLCRRRPRARARARPTVPPYARPYAGVGVRDRRCASTGSMLWYGRHTVFSRRSHPPCRRALGNMGNALPGLLFDQPRARDHALGHVGVLTSERVIAEQDHVPFDVVTPHETHTGH